MAHETLNPGLTLPIPVFFYFFESNNLRWNAIFWAIQILRDIKGF